MFLFNLFDRSVVSASLKTFLCQIDLSKNKLQKLDQGVLQPIFQSFAVVGWERALINVSSSKLFIYLSINSFYDINLKCQF